MSSVTEIHLSELPASLRKMLALFLITLTAAYLIGLGYVYFNTDMTYTGVAEDFRGSETEMKFEKPAGEMFQTVHNHMFGLSLTFLLTGAIFFFSSFPPGIWKTFFLTEPFISIIVSFGSFWLIRYFSPAWTYLLMLSGFLMALGFFVQVGWSLYDLMIRRGEE
ncbi:MAG: hypothetical protein K9N46_13915 [Candidatus Marinimicrobia bacterium]|nr:hypothetical protein [Candidatus Neomarinimicrobiota bacterium]MCF7829039.1 hypothetical protein [Candidatus Neomarinimicrobiota bacterium]MCF7881824.1 hypothetical protein [Candidatus Neomarinimicrobiota bacterium]